MTVPIANILIPLGEHLAWETLRLPLWSTDGPRQIAFPI